MEKRTSPTHLQLAHARHASRLPLRDEQGQRHAEDLSRFKSGDEAVKWADERHRQYRKETKKRTPRGRR